MRCQSSTLSCRRGASTAALKRREQAPRLGAAQGILDDNRGYFNSSGLFPQSKRAARIPGSTAAIGILPLLCFRRRAQIQESGASSATPFWKTFLTYHILNFRMKRLQYSSQYPCCLWKVAGKSDFQPWNLATFLKGLAFDARSMIRLGTDCDIHGS